MIQDYEIKNENVKAFDDNKGFIDYKYQDNIDDILIQENVVNKIIDDITNIKLDKILNEQSFNIRYNKTFQLISILNTTFLCAGICFILFYKIPLFALTLTILSSLGGNGILYLLLNSPIISSESQAFESKSIFSTSPICLISFIATSVNS